MPLYHLLQPTWDTRLTAPLPTTTTDTTSATATTQWADAHHALTQNKHPATDNNTPPQPSTTLQHHTPDIVLQHWATAVLHDTLHLPPHVWEAHTSTAYLPCQDDDTDATDASNDAPLPCVQPSSLPPFATQALVHHLAATRARTSAEWLRLVHPDTCTHAANTLQLHRLNLPTTHAGFVAFVQRLYADQTRRFEQVKDAFPKHTTEGSPLHTLFTTYAPTAQALSVVDAVVGAAWAVGGTADATDAMMHTSTVPETQWARVQRQFRKKYGCAPRMDTRFDEDGLYTCTIRHLDGVVIGEGRASVEAAAVELAAGAVGG